MKLLLLGTSGYHPTNERHTACFMLPELGIVLDAGTAMFRVRDAISTPELDIFLSHAHLDHIVGLTYLLDIMYEKPLTRVTVHGSADNLAAIRKHLFSEPLFPVLPKCEFREMAESPTLAQGGRLTHFPLGHPGGSRGFRLDWPDRSLAYVTDTTASLDASYVDKIRGVDLLLHECTFADGHEEFAKLTGHSCTTPVAEVAKAAGVGRLIFIHFNSLITDKDPVGLAAAQRVFPQTSLGYDGMAVEF